MDEVNEKQPLSERKRQAILVNLAKAREAKTKPGKPGGPPPVLGLKQVAATSPAVKETAAELAALLQSDGLTPVRPVDRVALEQASIAIEKVRTLDRYLRKHGMVRPKKGEVRPAAELLLKYLREAREWLGELGATPKARAALGLDVARQVDVAVRLAELRAERPKPIDGKLVADPGPETAPGPQDRDTSPGEEPGPTDP
ncbi:MAG TPA: P27 family phage terminase small subunit [Firmicutes bacterium]|nr:P27 family phage terminase small subunit [Bacillota bacterium]